MNPFVEIVTHFLSIETGDQAMRSPILLMSCFLILTPTVAHAQDGTRANTIYANLSAEELKDYCIWGDEAYSIGAYFCTARSVSVQCVAPSWEWIVFPAPPASPTPPTTPPIVSKPPLLVKKTAYWNYTRTGDCDPNPAQTPD